jgi:hypothetical protein
MAVCFNSNFVSSSSITHDSDEDLQYSRRELYINFINNQLKHFISFDGDSKDRIAYFDKKQQKIMLSENIIQYFESDSSAEAKKKLFSLLDRFVKNKIIMNGFATTKDNPLRVVDPQHVMFLQHIHDLSERSMNPKLFDDCQFISDDGVMLSTKQRQWSIEYIPSTDKNRFNNASALDIAFESEVIYHLGSYSYSTHEQNVMINNKRINETIRKRNDDNYIRGEGIYNRTFFWNISRLKFTDGKLNDINDQKLADIEFRGIVESEIIKKHSEIIVKNQ